MTRVIGITSGLRRRLLVMLIAPLILLTLLNAWFDYRSADGQAIKQDQQLLAAGAPAGGFRDRAGRQAR